MPESYKYASNLISIEFSETSRISTLIPGCKYELETGGIGTILLAGAETQVQEEKWLVWPGISEMGRKRRRQSKPKATGRIIPISPVSSSYLHIDQRESFHHSLPFISARTHSKEIRGFSCFPTTWVNHAAVLITLGISLGCSGVLATPTSPVRVLLHCSDENGERALPLQWRGLGEFISQGSLQQVRPSQAVRSVGR